MPVSFPPSRNTVASIIDSTALGKDLLEASNGSIALSDLGLGSSPTSSLSSVNLSATGNLTVGGTTVMTGVLTAGSVAISGGTIDGTAIGSITPSTIHATSLATSGAATLASLSTGSATIGGGTVDNTGIGSTTPSTGAFTTLKANSLVLTGTLTVNSYAIHAGTIDNTTIGATTPSTGAFTSLTASGTASFGTVLITAANISGGTITGVTVDGVVIGATTPSAAHFTTVSSTGAASLASLAVSGSTTLASLSATSGSLGSLSVTGTSTLASATLSGTISVTGAATLSGGFSATSGGITGNLAVGNALSISGALTGSTAAFSGIITAATPADGANNTQVATTAYVNRAIGENTVGAASTPTAMVGLSVVAGSSATFMRSDAAPPLDQSINPNWTGTHTFSKLVTANGGISTPSAVITGGSIDGATIGGTTPGAAHFTTLSATGATTMAALTATGTITGGNLTTAGTVSAANITSSGNISATSGTISTSTLSAVNLTLSGSATIAGTLGVTGVTTLSSANFGSVAGTAGTTNKLALYSTSYGFGISPSSLDYVTGGAHSFYQGSTLVGQITSTGLNAMKVGATTPSTGSFTSLSASGVLSAYNSTSLSGTASTNQNVFSTGLATTNVDTIRFDYNRFATSPGTSWSTAYARIYRNVDATPMGFVQFGNATTASQQTVELGSGSTSVLQVSASSLNISQPATITSTLGVTGATTLAGLSATSGSFSSTLGVTGLATFANVDINGGTLDGTAIGSSVRSSIAATTLSTSGAATVSGTLGVTGAATFASTLAVNGISPYTAISSSYEWHPWASNVTYASAAPNGATNAFVYQLLNTNGVGVTALDSKSTYQNVWNYAFATATLSTPSLNVAGTLTASGLATLSGGVSFGTSTVTFASGSNSGTIYNDGGFHMAADNSVGMFLSGPTIQFRATANAASSWLVGSSSAVTITPPTTFNSSLTTIGQLASTGGIFNNGNGANGLAGVNAITCSHTSSPTFRLFNSVAPGPSGGTAGRYFEQYVDANGLVHFRFVNGAYTTGPEAFNINSDVNSNPTAWNFYGTTANFGMPVTTGALTASTGSFSGAVTLGAATTSSSYYASNTSGAQFLGRGYMHYSDGANYYVLLSGATGTVSTSFNGLRPFYINLSSGYVGMGNGLGVTGGTTTDSLRACLRRIPLAGLA